jgi:hypothetical protein
MPCKECTEGKYKWGETGECEYDTLQECEEMLLIQKWILLRL